jgi:two-component system, cell cycle response regulator DivK
VSLSGSTCLTVLVVDDIADSRFVLSKLMLSSDYRVVEAADGAGAIEAARRERPDLVLLDLNLPVMDGLEVARRLRELPHMRNVPIVAVTAYDYYGIREAALEAGCDEYLAKPLDFELLARVVDRMIGR